MSIKVEIYSSSTCHYCQEAKDFFKEKNIEYIEHNISENREAKRNLMKKGIMSVPYIVINDGDFEANGFNKELVTLYLDGKQGGL